MLTKRINSSESEGAGGMWIAVVVVWLCVVLYLTPAMFALWAVAPGWVEKVGLGLFIAVLGLFWFFGVYYVLVPASGIWHSAARAPREPETDCLSGGEPEVLLLYPTRNDFRREAIEALRRVRGRCEVVICDDSTLERYTREIDAFVAEVSPSDELNPVRVVRRAPGSAGWKAGNVNHALRETGVDWDYFAICDADGIFLEDFVEKLLAHFLNADGAEGVPVAFVQARQEGNPAQADAFGRAMSVAVGAHFRHVVRGRQEGGFVMFYGHGALISMEAWRAVGGFPEIVTEDLAFSLKLRAAGWRGVYADDVVCYEDFPATWQKLRRRSEKWIRGTADCLRHYFAPFLRSRRVPWWEKLDVLVHGATHGMAVPMLMFLLVLGTVLPWGMKEFRMPGGFFLPPVAEGKNLVEQAMGLRYHVFWSWDFYLVMLLTMLGPSLPLLMEAVSGGFRLSRKRSDPPDAISPPALGGLRIPNYLGASAFVYLAGLVAEAWAVAAYVLTGKAYFRTTNDAADVAAEPHGVQGWSARLNINHPVVSLLELVAGVGFLWAMIAHRNAWFLAPAVGLLLSPLVAHVGWENRLVRALTWLPLIATAALLFLIGWQLLRER